MGKIFSYAIYVFMVLGCALIMACGGGGSSSSIAESTHSDGSTTTSQNGSSTTSSDHGDGATATTDGEDSEDTAVITNGEDSSSCGTELFSVSPITLTDLNTTGIVPLGNLAAPAHTFPTPHLYFHIRDAGGDGAPVDNVPFYSPGDITITSITSSENLTVGLTDYVIRFLSCTEVQGYFDHVATLNGTLQTAFDMAEGNCQTYSDGVWDYQQCEKTVSLSAQAGEQLGTAGGETTQSAALDFGLRDSRITALVYANPDRLYSASDGFDSYHVACAIDYYSSDVKNQLEEKLNRIGDVEPLCGEVAHDVAETAKGKWYLEGTPSPTNEESDHLALVTGNIDPAQSVISAGNASLGSGEYYFSPQSSGLVNRNFEEVRADNNIYCYHSLSSRLGSSYTDTVFLIQLTNSTTLKIEKQTSSGCGSGPWTLTSSAITFER